MIQLERAARALEPLAWAALGFGDTAAHASLRASSLRKARAVLQAIREPSDAMAARAAMLHLSGPASEVSSETWRAVIDAALEESSAD